ncbi:hypothetical protein P170DRAFT_511007 [Aspergillus steynii IBT 23096]|uniref:Uncharacterized protein n=1 Tax=Aspergillus steynii IBT 23096 TaxID=1392250 RepID=A0A2I2G691_9EURO|nr:uncharacterized protein P170DRAFT_511007 [Aspergillus steynii IBT 23096]PLB48394.1 hypothetical protein P170DRAFT_511007 [Aspergillus steynii IBT 23096]
MTSDIPCQTATKWALLIGIDLFDAGKSPFISIHDRKMEFLDLKGCVRDIDRVERHLLSEMGVAKRNIRKLTTEAYFPLKQDPDTRCGDPTYANIICGLNWIIENAKAGDLVYLQYSGHGGQATTVYPELKGEDGIDECLLPSDLAKSAGGALVRDIELGLYIKKMLGKKLVLTVVMDCCHSGSITRGSSRPDNARQVDSIYKSTSDDKARADQDLDRLGFERDISNQVYSGDRTSQPWLLEIQGYTLLAACRPREFAMEPEQADNIHSGNLTYWLLDTLQSLPRTHKTPVSTEMLFQRLGPKIRNASKELQNPVIGGSVDKEFFGTDIPPRVPAITVHSVDGDRENLTLDSGSIHGVVRNAEYIIWSRTTNGELVEVRVFEVSPSTAKATTLKTMCSKEQVDVGCKAVLSYVPPAERFVVLLPEESQHRDKLEKAWNEFPEEKRPEFMLMGQAPDEDFMFRLTIDETEVNVVLKDMVNMRDPPSMPFDGSIMSVERLVYRLRHLASFQLMKTLKSSDAVLPMRNAVSFTIVGQCKKQEEVNNPSKWEMVQYVDGMFVATHGAFLVVHVKNLSDKVLDFSIFDLNPAFGITKYYPKSSVTESLDPNGEKLLCLRMRVPEAFHKENSIFDTFKLFFAPRSISLERFTLEDLQSAETGATRGGKNPLDTLKSLVNKLRRPERHGDDPSDDHVEEWGVEKLDIRTLWKERETFGNEALSFDQWRLALQHHEKYRESSVRADLEKAIKCAERSIKSIPPYNQAINLSTLGKWWNESFDDSGNPQDINEGISCCQMAVRLSLTTHHNHPKILDCLAQRLVARFKALLNEEDLDSAISLGSEAVGLVKKEHASRKQHPDFALVIQGQIQRQYQQFLMFSNGNALTGVIKLYEYLVDGTGNNSPYRPGRLCNLAGKLGERYKQHHEERDLTECIKIDQRALRALEELSERGVSTVPGTRGNILSRYSLHLSWVFERNGLKPDLCNSIKQARDAVEAAEGDLQRAKLLGNLANRLLTGYEVYGSCESLDEAVSKAEKALLIMEQTQKKSKVDHVHILHTLGNALIAKHEQSHEEARLDGAIKYFREAVELMPSEPFLQVLTQNGLASGLFHKYERTGEITCLKEAIDSNEKALDAVVNDPTGKAKVLNNLATQYHSLFMNSKKPENLEKAIAHGRKALEASVLTYDRMIHSINLANYLETRFDLFGRNSDINDAVTEAEGSYVLLSQMPDTPMRARIVYLYALKLRKKSKANVNQEPSDLANTILRDALLSSHSPARELIQCALLHANIMMSKGNDKEVYAICQIIMGLIPSLVASSSCQKDQQDELVEFEGVARKAAAIALDMNEGPVNALRLLQAGRGVIANQLLTSRDDRLWVHDFLSTPGECHTPDLQLKACMASTQNYVEVANASEDPRAKYKPYLSCELRNFLDSNPSGTIVLINVSFRCDAFLLDKNGLDQVHLKGVNEEEVQQQASLIASGSPGKQVMLNMLKWLWDFVASPILERLGHGGPVNHDLPRVWWIPTGKLAHLPIHAAGDYHSGNFVLNRVSSSYSPTLKSLLFAYASRKDNTRFQTNLPAQKEGTPSSGNDSEPKAVIVYMRETPRKSPLDHVESEARAVYDNLPQSSKRLLPEPSKETVLKSLEGCDIFHFAGHGEADKSDPSKSRLLLSNGPIRVLDILQRVPGKPTNAFLSYLSACSSGSNVVNGLDEEGLHVMGAFILAGFRHVIGSLWPVSDSHCVDVAKAVYSRIVEANMTDDSVSQALHQAICHLSHPGASNQPGDQPQVKGAGLLAENPYIWAAFVHMGV